VNKAEKEKLLLENLERILKGSQSEIPKPLDDDTRTALEFAQKMMAMREAPSEDYKNKLKAQIIQRLAEQEKKEGIQDHDISFWQLHRRTMWRATIAAAVVVVIWAIILLLTTVFRFSCSVPATSQPSTPAATNSISTLPL
jgi:hypothetical protein